MMRKLMSIMVATILAMGINGFAEAATSGGKNTATINVQTQADWKRTGAESITLVNNAVTIKYLNLFGKEKSKTIYPKFNIKIRSADGKQRFSRIMSSKTVKINLKPDRRYYIEVSYDGNGTWLKYARLKNARMEGNPYWYVSATHKVNSYW